jgi:hypothetical protein
MTNTALVARKLSLIDEHLRRLRERRPAEVGAFKTDSLLQDAVSLGVLVVVQEAIDIALHIASDEGWELTIRDQLHHPGAALFATHPVAITERRAGPCRRERDST